MRIELVCSSLAHPIAVRPSASKQLQCSATVSLISVPAVHIIAATKEYISHLGLRLRHADLEDSIPT